MNDHLVIKRVFMRKVLWVKRIVLILFLISLFLLFGCPQPEAENSTAPHIYEPELSSAYYLDKNSHPSYNLDDEVSFSFKLEDSDLDASYVILTQKSNSLEIDPIQIPLPKQPAMNTIYYGNIVAAHRGDWTISLYVVDSKGNKSNTLTENIKVYGRIKVVYDLNGGTGTVPIDEKEYKLSDSIKAMPSIGFSKYDYKFYGWAADPNGEGVIINYYPFYAYQYVDDNDQITLYAIWQYQPFISNVSYTVNNETIKINWENPMPNNFYSEIYILTNFILSDNTVVPIPQTFQQKYLNKETNNYTLYVPNNVEYNYIEVKLCTCRYSYNNGTDYDPDVSIKIYDKVINTPPAEVSNISNKVTYYGGTTFSLTKPLDEDLEFVLFVWPWGAEHKYLANAETFETQYGPEQLDYVIIKTIDKSGNVSSGIRYNLK